MKRRIILDYMLPNYRMRSPEYSATFVVIEIFRLKLNGSYLGLDCTFIIIINNSSFYSLLEHHAPCLVFLGNFKLRSPPCVFRPL